eukprot:scaffold90494_cov38-Cyclotella_meneghiniana.AAC.1
MSPRTIIRSLVGSLGGDGDRYGGRITASSTATGSEGIRDCRTATHLQPLLSDVLEQHLWPKTCSHKLLTTSVVSNLPAR